MGTGGLQADSETRFAAWAARLFVRSYTAPPTTVATLLLLRLGECAWESEGWCCASIGLKFTPSCVDPCVYGAAPSAG